MGSYPSCTWFIVNYFDALPDCMPNKEVWIILKY